MNATACRGSLLSLLVSVLPLALALACGPRSVENSWGAEQTSGGSGDRRPRDQGIETDRCYCLTVDPARDAGLFSVKAKTTSGRTATMSVRVAPASGGPARTPDPSEFSVDGRQRTLQFQLEPLDGASTFSVQVFMNDPDLQSESVVEQCEESRCT